MPADKWGHPFFYPTKTNGFFYQQSNDIRKDSHFNGEGDITNIDTTDGEWTFETDGPSSVQIFKNSDSANSIGGCDMDFEKTVERGYGYKPDDPRDIELKFLIKFVDANSDNGFAIEGPTGRHSGDGCCQGFAYKLDVDDFQHNPTKWRFRKEMWHVSNHNDPKTGIWTHALSNFKLLGHSKYVGIGYCHYVKQGGANSGHNTPDSVVLEAWFNPDPDANKNNWVMLKRTEDKGGWGNDGDECNGDDDQIGAWSNSNFRLKSNAEGGEFRIKNLSLREIDPTKSFDDAPETPEPGEEPSEGTTTIQGKFKFQWDLNTIRTSECAGSGNVLFFDWGSYTEDDKVFRIDITRVANIIKNSSSPAVGKIIKQLDVPLKKVGSPSASPTVSAKIWSPSGSVVYTSPTTFDPSTFTTSYVSKTFDFSTNTHSCVTGDKIGIEYNSPSDTDTIICSFANDLGNKEIYIQYTNGVWVEVLNTDFICNMWQ